MNIRYAVIGTGALGGYYGGRLAHAGKDVHFLLNSDYQHVREHGLKVDSVNGDFHLGAIQAYDNTRQMPPCDVVLVCLKTNNNAMLRELLPPLLHRGTMVVLVQNGLGIERDLARQFPGLPIAGGLAFICSSRLGPGHIGHFDFGNITFGVYQNGDDALVQQLCADFTQSSIGVELAPDLNLARWKKLVWNIPYNGMTVILGTATDKLMKNPASRQLIWDVMLEVTSAARHCGANLSDDFAVQMMEATDRMTPYAPSMKLDFDARRPMEIAAIYSSPAETALEAGFEMKKVRVLEQQLRFLQSTYTRL